MLTLGMAGIVKDEADALLEWIAYHRAIGIDRFFIADNESTDGTREMLAALQEQGIVEVIDVRTLPDKMPQIPAYEALLQCAKGQCDVLAFIDADEFILPTDDENTIKPLIESIFSDQNVSALGLNWAIFGSSGAIFMEKGLTIERFTKRARPSFGIHHHYKTLVRPERCAGFANPHHARLTDGKYVNSRHEEIVSHPKHGKGLSATITWHGARINHYATKSVEEFLLKKSRRGSAAKASRVKHKKYFISHDRNDTNCRIATRFATATHAEIKELQKLIELSLENRRQGGTLRSFKSWLQRKMAAHARQA